MSCACENIRLGSELERIRRLAKGLARIEQKTVVIVRNSDGTYGFCPEGESENKPIVEFVTQY